MPFDCRVTNSNLAKGGLLNGQDQDKNNRFVTDDEKKSWNNKVDRPLYGTTTSLNMTEGQILYDPSTDIAQFMLDGRLRSIKMGVSNFAISGMTSGTSTFAGNGQERKILHGAIKSDGSMDQPRAILFNPSNLLKNLF